jgi:hypothetical protein
MKLLNPFGILESTGELVTVDQVANGNACGCICPVCNQPLQARQGQGKAHHFSHIGNIDCKPETILHKVAKKIFEANSCIRLPDGRGCFHYKHVELEKRFDGFQPDIVLSDSAGNCLLVEVAVTSFIKQLKLNRIIAADLGAEREELEPLIISALNAMKMKLLKNLIFYFFILVSESTPDCKRTIANIESKRKMSNSSHNLQEYYAPG